MNERARKIRTAYAAFLGALTVLVGLCFLIELAKIYTSDASPLFSYADVSRRVRLLAIPLALWAVGAVGGVLVTCTMPACSERGKPSERTVYARLRRNLPTGSGEEYTALRARIRKFEWLRTGLWLAVFAFGLVAAILCAVRIFTASEYVDRGINDVVISLMKYVAPFFFATVVLVAAMLVFEMFGYRRMLPVLKTLYKKGERGTREMRTGSRFAAVKGALSSPIAIHIVQACIAILAVVFIVLGALNGGANDVLGKAVMICTECIGLG